MYIIKNRSKNFNINKLINDNLKVNDRNIYAHINEIPK